MELAKASRLLESITAAADERLLAGARRRWASLPFGRMLGLAQVVADCRRAECVQAYRTLVHVAAGLKRRRDDAGFEYLYREPCIVFVVRKKMRDEQIGLRAGQRLPRELLTLACIDGREEIVAVPTDVQPQSRVLRARAQAASGICTQASSVVTEMGSVACALVAGGVTFAMGPIHVFSPRAVDGGQGIRAEADVLRLSQEAPPFDDRPMLRTSSFGGRLARAPVRSFDAQFATLRDAGRLSDALGELRLSERAPWVTSIGDLGERLADGRLMEIHVPSNHLQRRVAAQPPLLAALSMTEVDQTFEYLFEDGFGAVLHRTLELQIQAGGATLPGDSGCPVVVSNDGDAPSFVGMHIAGNPKRGASFVIPAWNLMALECYLEVGGSGPAGDWRLSSRL